MKGVYNLKYNMTAIETAQSATEGNNVANTSKPKTYPADMIAKLKGTSSVSYMSGLMRKNKYTVRIALAGGFIGFCTAAYRKQSVWGGILIGGAIGTIVGYGFSTLIAKYELYLEEQKKNESQDKKW